MISDLIRVIKRVYFRLTITHEKTYICNSHTILSPNFNSKPQILINYINSQQELLHINYIKKTKDTSFILYFLLDQIIDYRKFYILEQASVRQVMSLRLMTHNYEHHMYLT